MFELAELIKKIDTLQLAEQNDALKKPTSKISDLKSASYFLCVHIHKEILNHYPERQRSKFPIFNAVFANFPFNLELLAWYKSQAYYLGYLTHKNNPSEHAKANIYLTMAEQLGFPFIGAVEFYQDQCEKITQAATAACLQKCYSNARINIKSQFILDTPKGRFLDLLMIIQIVNATQNNDENSYRMLRENFYPKIDAALKLFEKKLEDKTTAANFNHFFSTGAMQPFTSSQTFIDYVKKIPMVPNDVPQQSLNTSASTSSTSSHKQ